MEDVLTFKNVNFSYYEEPVIKDMSFSITPGEFAGLIGPNGSGKSTMVKITARYLKPSDGEVAYNGKNIYSYGHKKYAREVSVLPQSLKPVFSMKVVDFVLLGRMPYKSRFDKFDPSDMEEAEKAMKLADIYRLKDRTITELSGGEWQRVILAQALCQTPKMLLLDEPTTHLDIGHQVEVMDILYELNRDLDMTILMIVHDLNIAAEYCEKIYFINKGELKYSGAPHEVLTYEAIEEIYNVKALVYDNPTTKKPYVFPLPGRFTR